MKRFLPGGFVGFDGGVVDDTAALCSQVSCSSMLSC